ncbi:S8 family serine peptidase [Streptomyces sp. NPDC052494]|uniref:S8 family serine peptidase n=1 Tax=Streptomyces sp. NPDC052494 TaxID=3365692 RepID=UPI0037D006E2
MENLPCSHSTRTMRFSVRRLSGTSMASPYVSAVAALLHRQGLDPAAITQAIRDTAANPQKLAKLGLGNVDAAAAVKAAQSAQAAQNKG